MVIKTRSQLKGKVRDDYLGLVLKFPPASIKSEEQFQDAQAVIDDLLAKGKLGAGKRFISTPSVIWSLPMRMPATPSRLHRMPICSGT